MTLSATIPLIPLFTPETPFSHPLLPPSLYVLPHGTLDELIGVGNCQGMSDTQNGQDAKAR